MPNTPCSHAVRAMPTATPETHMARQCPLYRLRQDHETYCRLGRRNGTARRSPFRGNLHFILRLSRALGNTRSLAGCVRRQPGLVRPPPHSVYNPIYPDPHWYLNLSPRPWHPRSWHRCPSHHHRHRRRRPPLPRPPRRSSRCPRPQPPRASPPWPPHPGSAPRTPS